jgi:predicted dehydrogenase
MAGVRGHNDYIFDSLADLPDVRIVGLCAAAAGDDISPLKRHCDDFAHEGRVYDDYAAMLDAAKPDMVSIAGPFERHAEMCTAAFERGIHVFCEKPVAMTVAEGTALEIAHRRSGVHFAAMMGLRYDPALFTARQAVAGGAVGEVRLINARKSYKLGERAEFYRHRATYGGTIPWVGSHAVDWIQWFSGAEFESVWATHSTSGNRGYGELESSALCHFTLAGDMFASASIDYFRPDTAPTHGDDRVRVVGTGGVIEVHYEHVSLINAATDGVQRLAPVCERKIFADFVAHISGDTTALIGPADTFAVTRACLLARQSADEGRVVRFDEVDIPGGRG